MIVLVVLGGLLLASYFRRRKVRSSIRANMATIALPPLQARAGTTVEQLPNPYPPFVGTLIINDPLRDNQAGYGWMDDSKIATAEVKGCHFCDDTYRLSIDNNQTPHMVYCLALRTNFSNFVYQIEATLLRGTEIGLVFRQTPGFRYYYFYIRRDGTYGLDRYNGITQQPRHLADGFSLAISIELNQPNELAVVANGNIIDLYANHSHLTTVIDDTYSSGRVATGAATDANSPAEAAFKNVLLWILE